MLRNLESLEEKISSFHPRHQHFLAHLVDLLGRHIHACIHAIYSQSLFRSSWQDNISYIRRLRQLLIGRLTVVARAFNSTGLTGEVLPGFSGSLAEMLARNAVYSLTSLYIQALLLAMNQSNCQLFTQTTGQLFAQVQALLPPSIALYSTATSTATSSASNSSLTLPQSSYAYNTAFTNDDLDYDSALSYSQSNSQQVQHQLQHSLHASTTSTSVSYSINSSFLPINFFTQNALHKFFLLQSMSSQTYLAGATGGIGAAMSGSAMSVSFSISSVDRLQEDLQLLTALVEEIRTTAQLYRNTNRGNTPNNYTNTNSSSNNNNNNNHQSSNNKFLYDQALQPLTNIILAIQMPKQHLLEFVNSQLLRDFHAPQHFQLLQVILLWRGEKRESVIAEYEPIFQLWRSEHSGYLAHAHASGSVHHYEKYHAIAMQGYINKLKSANTIKLT